MPEPPSRGSECNTSSSPPTSGLDRRLCRSQRLISSRLFSETFSQHKKWVGRYMILWIRTGDDAALRLGVITSKKVHLRANKRNFARRRLREAYRRIRPYLTGNIDLLIIGRRSILDAEWTAVIQELLSLTTKAGLLTPETQQQAKAELLSSP